MAEFLIRAFDSHNPDPIKDETECWKKGDIVDIREDGFVWKVEELNTKRFTILKVPGVTVASVEKYCQPATDIANPRRSLYKVDFEKQEIQHKIVPAKITKIADL